MKYYVEKKDGVVVAIHSIKPIGIETKEIDESELKKYKMYMAKGVIENAE